MATWVVTGANRGIGLELARQLCARGDTVIATTRDLDRADTVAALGARVEQLDVVDPASVARFRQRLAADTVDVLINNAGVGGPRPGVADLDFDHMLAQLATNAVGPMRVTQALLAPLRRGSDKLVVHVSSALASIADADRGGAYGYRASKAALNMLVRCLAAELGAEGFRCVAVSPGWVQTDMGGTSAPLSAEDSVRGMLRVAAAVTADDNGAFLDHAGTRLPW